MLEAPHDVLEWYCTVSIAALAVIASVLYIGYWLYDELTNLDK